MGIVRNGAPHELMLLVRDRLGIRTFVETGTSVGNTASWAAGQFERVFTVEAAARYHDLAVAAHGHLVNVEFVLGDSREALPRIVAGLGEPAMFWLDGHYSGDDTAGSGDECPLLEELAAVRSSSLPHTIFVDDARLFESPPPRPHDRDDWPTIDAVIDAVRQDELPRYVAIVEDVIAAVPVAATDVLAGYAQDVSTRTWEASLPKPSLAVKVRVKVASLSAARRARREGASTPG